MKTKKNEAHYFICIANKDCDDLALHKVYEAMPDADAESEGLLRIVDESGEDYLYPATCFMPITLPKTVERALQMAS